MPVLFEPETLEQEIEELLIFCQEHGMDCTFNGFEEYEASIEEADEDNLEQTLYTYDTPTELILPRSEYDEEGIFKLSEILDMVEEAKNSKLIDNYILLSEKFALIRITTINTDFMNSDFMDLGTEIKIQDNYYKVDIVTGMTSFNLRLTIEEKYNKYVPPIGEDEIFIRISTATSVNEKDLDIIFNAYFFELKSTLNLEIQINPWEYELWDEAEEMDDSDKNLKLRPLIQGKGVQELLEIYKSAFNTNHPEQQILTFSRVIEYVSQTVIRKDLIEKTVLKLSSSRALSPDANYILELGKIYEEHKSLRKDYLAFKITIETCCDVYELIKVAPNYLKKTKKITLQSSSEEQKKALEEIASSISSTRNMFAHAKTNYDQKGDECPIEYFHEFAKLMNIISQQIIKWFSRQQEDTRII